MIVKRNMSVQSQKTVFSIVLNSLENTSSCSKSPYGILFRLHA